MSVAGRVVVVEKPREAVSPKQGAEGGCGRRVRTVEEDEEERQDGEGRNECRDVVERARRAADWEEDATARLAGGDQRCRRMVPTMMARN